MLDETPQETHGTEYTVVFYSPVYLNGDGICYSVSPLCILQRLPFIPPHPISFPAWYLCLYPSVPLCAWCSTNHFHSPFAVLSLFFRCSSLPRHTEHRMLVPVYPSLPLLLPFHPHTCTSASASPSSPPFSHAPYTANEFYYSVVWFRGAADTGTAYLPLRILHCTYVRFGGHFKRHRTEDGGRRKWTSMLILICYRTAAQDGPTNTEYQGRSMVIPNLRILRVPSPSPSLSASPLSAYSSLHIPLCICREESAEAEAEAKTEVIEADRAEAADEMLKIASVHQFASSRTEHVQRERATEAPPWGGGRGRYARGMGK